MDFDETIKKRRSVRTFAKKSVSWKKLLEAIDSTIQNPFAGNINNLKFLIIEKKETIKAVAKHANQSWIFYAPCLVIVTSDDTHLEKLYGERGRIYSRQQTGAAIQTLLLKLTDLNLDSCWIGAYTDELLKEQLRIPQHNQIEAIIAIGYRDRKEKVQEKKKKELENIIYWEGWGKTKRPTWFDEGKEPYAIDYS